MGYLKHKDEKLRKNMMYQNYRKKQLKEITELKIIKILFVKVSLKVFLPVKKESKTYKNHY